MARTRKFEGADGAARSRPGQRHLGARALLTGRARRIASLAFGTSRRQHLVFSASVLLLVGAGVALIASLDDPSEAVSVLFVVPVALAALEWGLWGGLVAAFLALGLFAAWELPEG